MDPITAALNAYTATMNALIAFYNGATTAQKETLVQQHIDGVERWWKLIDRLTPTKD